MPIEVRAHSASLLEPPERSQTMPRQNRQQVVVHRQGAELRERVYFAFAESGNPALEKRAEIMVDCARRADQFWNPEAMTVRPHLYTCKERLCPFCARIRSRKVARAMARLVKDMVHPVSIVLTLRSSSAPLAGENDRLIEGFKQLRRTAWWKHRVGYGCATVEITLSEKTRLWHPHLHVLCDAAWVDQKALSVLWNEITGDSRVVWVEEVHDRHNAVAELCKYVGKPQKADHWLAEDLIDYALAVHGQHMVITFGPKPVKPISDEIREELCRRTERCISMPKLFWLVDQGNVDAARLLELIAEHQPWLGQVIFDRYPQLETDAARSLRAARILAARAPPGTIVVQVGVLARSSANLVAEMIPLFQKLDQFADVVMPVGPSPV